MCTRMAMLTESAGNFGSCGSPRLITTFCNPRLRTRLRRLCKYLGTMSSAMMRPLDPTIGDSSYDVVAATRADVRNCYPGFDAEQTHELARFAGIVALLFVVPDRTDNVRDRAIGFRKGDRRNARLRDEVLRSA